MSQQVQSVLSAWLDNFYAEQRDLTSDDLLRRESILADLERDVKFATDELSRRRHSSPPMFCVDFDVMYEASQLHATGGQIPFWSALLFYLNAAKQVVLPGTLFETLSFFRRNSHEEIGSLGSRFLDAFSSPSVFDPSFRSVLDSAGRSFKQKRLYQKRYIFSLLQSRCEVFSSGDIGEFDAQTFDTAVSILAHANRRDKVDSNRVDALNFSIVNQKFRSADKPSPEFVLISNSLALRNLQRTTFDPRHPIRGRSKHIIWNPRSASIFQCICAVTDNLRDASEMAWDVYQEIVDERRATQYMIDRVAETGGTVTPVRHNFQSDISALIFGVELHDRSALLGNRDFPFDSGIESPEEIDAAHEKLNHEISEYLENIIEKHELTSYKALVKNKPAKVDISEQPVDKRFSCRSHFKVSSEQSTSHDSILIYDDKVQIVVEGNISPLRFAAAVDKVRSRIRGRLIKNQISDEHPDEDLCQATILAKGNVVRTDRVDLKWAILSPPDVDDDDDIAANDLLGLDNKTSEIVNRLRRIFISAGEGKLDFFRLSTKYFDASFEGDVVVLTATVTPLKEEFALFYSALSDHKVENFGDRVYQIAERQLGRALLPK